MQLYTICTDWLFRSYRISLIIMSWRSLTLRMAFLNKLPLPLGVCCGLLLHRRGVIFNRLITTLWVWTLTPVAQIGKYINRWKRRMLTRGQINTPHFCLPPKNLSDWLKSKQLLLNLSAISVIFLCILFSHYLRSNPHRKYTAWMFS